MEEMSNSRRILAWWGIITFLVILSLSLQVQSFAAPEPSSSTTKEKLQNEKLLQETIKLRLENETLQSPWGKVISFGTFLTALAAIIGVVLTFLKQIAERSRQQELDRLQRETESLRRMDEKFTAIIMNLGSESPAIQASAAVSLVSFLKPEYRVFHSQVFMILLANLKIQHLAPINKLLIEVFEKAVRLQVQSAQDAGEQLQLDLSRTFLNRVDLSGLNLSQADIGFAQLQGANLREADLSRVRAMKAHLEKARLSRANLNEGRLRSAYCREAHFHASNLVAADLKEADLSRAEFHQARMQSAHLEKAELRGAKFEEADLNDTYFTDAVLDPEALKSIIKAKNWQKAHFSAAVKVQLDELIAASA
jgi:uncharacterized protein YjbI with pentapeptide repeats